MAKGQKRSSRETKKPKAKKEGVAAATPGTIFAGRIMAPVGASKKRG